MVLQVPFEEFARACHAVARTKVVFLNGHPSGSLVTCADPANNVLVASVVTYPLATTLDLLTQQGFEVFRGQWTVEGDLNLEGAEVSEAHVAAIAYRSSASKPGLWVDAFPTEPSEVQVLRAMYDEFRDNGEIEEVTFEEFLRELDANVVIVPPSQLHRFLEVRSRPVSEC